MARLLGRSRITSTVPVSSSLPPTLMKPPTDWQVLSLLRRYFISCGSYVQTASVGDRSLRSEEHTSELQSPCNLVCRLLLEKKKHCIKCAHAWRRMFRVLSFARSLLLSHYAGAAERDHLANRLS